MPRTIFYAGARLQPASPDNKDGRRERTVPSLNTPPQTFSTAHDENIKHRRPGVVAATSARATTAGLVRTRRGSLRNGGTRASRRRSQGRRVRRWLQRWFDCDQNDLIVFGVQRAGFGARLGLHRLFHFKTGRAG